MKIKLDKISITYQNEDLLNNLSLEFESGKLSCLLGPSGSGKTTLLKIIAGIEEQFIGDVLFENEIVNDIPVGKRQIGWVPQQQLLFPGLNVYENIAYGLTARKTPNDKIRIRVAEIAKLVGVEHLLQRFPNRLSGGERQRVAIARALAPNPRILLLDEPFSSLDTPERDKLALILREIQLITKITTIHVTHSPREAELLADNIFVLADGELQQSGSMHQLKKNPKSIHVASILGIPNVFTNWETKQAIIPVDAVQISDMGKIDAIIIAITSDRIFLKTDENRLEIKRSHENYILGQKVKINIDEMNIKYL